MRDAKKVRKRLWEGGTKTPGGGGGGSGRHRAPLEVIVALWGNAAQWHWATLTYSALKKCTTHIGSSPRQLEWIFGAVALAGGEPLVLVYSASILPLVHEQTDLRECPKRSPSVI